MRNATSKNLHIPTVTFKNFFDFIGIYFLFPRMYCSCIDK